MADAVWPGELPQKVLVGSYKETPPSLTIRTPMDTGPAKVRRRTTAGVRPLEWSQAFTQEEIAILDAFYVNDCASGAIAFVRPHPRTGRTARMRFITIAWTRFGRSRLWKADFSIEVLPG